MTPSAAQSRARGKATSQGWPTDRKVALVLAGLRGDRPVAQLCREAGISPTRYYQWRKEFIAAARDGLAGSDLKPHSLMERIEQLEAENANLRVQVHIFRDLCLAE